MILMMIISILVGQILLVEDKANPAIQCPPDVTVSCTDDMSLSLGRYTDITNNTQLLSGIVRGYSSYPSGGPSPGEGIAWGSCSLPSVSYQDQGDLYCGGLVIRTWRASKEVQGHDGTTSTVTVSCQQRITVTDDTPFYYEFPADITIDCADHIGHRPSDLAQYNSYDAGGHLVDFYDEPRLEYDCEQLGVSHEDEYFDLCETAFKVRRVWTLVDLCDKNISIQHIQEIAIMDSTAPDLMVGNITVRTSSNSCTEYVDVVAVFSDDCSAVVVTNDSPYSEHGSGADASGEYPKGLHTVNFRAEDACGNVSEETITIRVLDGKAPQVICQKYYS